MKKLSTQQWVLMAIILAMLLLLSMVPPLNYMNIAQIGFGFLGSAFAGALCGPFYAPIINIAKVILSYFLINSVGTLFPLSIFSSALGAFIYAKMLWRREKSWKNIITAVVLNTIFANLILNTIFVVIIYQEAWLAILPMRLAKNAVSLVINSIGLYYFFNNHVVRRLLKEFEF